MPELLALPGCGELSAARLLGESAGITRFRGEATFARHGGLAPIPVWSGSRSQPVGSRQEIDRWSGIALCTARTPRCCWAANVPSPD